MLYIEKKIAWVFNTYDGIVVFFSLQVCSENCNKIQFNLLLQVYVWTLTGKQYHPRTEVG